MATAPITTPAAAEQAVNGLLRITQAIVDTVREAGARWARRSPRCTWR